MEEPPTPERSHQWPQILAVLSSLLLVVSTTTHAGWVSPALPKLVNGELGFNITKHQASMVVSLYPLAFVVAAPISAFFLDTMGRKCSLLIIVFPQMGAWLLIKNARNFYMLYISRLSSGFAEGCVFTMLPLYICEISEPSIRGKLGTSFATAYTFGFFLINCYASYMTIRSSAVVSICIPLLFVLTFIWMPQSPYYLIMKGYTADARKCLMRLRNMDNVEEELTRLQKDVDRQLSEPGTLKDIFTIRSNLKALLIVAGLRTVQQFTGGVTFLYYAQIIFEQADGSISYSKSAIIFSGFNTLVTCTGMPLVDRFGRRVLLLYSIFGTICCLFIIAVYFTFQYCNYQLTSFRWVPLTALVVYTISRGIGITTIPSLMTGELFSISIKSKASAIMSIYYALSLTIATEIFSLLKDYTGIHVPFFFFACISIGSCVFIYYCVPETKGKSLEQIQQELKGAPIIN